MPSLILISKAFSLFRTALLPSQFGFVQCHSYLTDDQLNQLKEILETKDAVEKEHAISTYEKEFAKLVGSGFASSFASGRMAFYALMEALGVGEGDEVVLTAFTCSVMPNAVLKRKARPIYANVDRHTFGSSVIEIEKVISAKTKLIVAQHSFGIPCDIEPIIRLAKERGIYVVEDCAIALDSSLNGIKVGNWGDAAIFSTDHSKPLNTMIGGMLYTQNAEIHKRVERIARLAPQLSYEHQENLYRQMLFEKAHFIPKRYPRARIHGYVRKIWSRLRGVKQAIFLEENYTRPASINESYPYPAAMPAFLALLGGIELKRWDAQKNRRKKLLADMLDIFRQSRYSAHIPAVYDDPSREIVPLRFVFSWLGAGDLLRRIGKYVDVNWIWFRQPVTCAVEGMESLQYSNNSCPISEEVCSGIVNLPCNVTEGWETKLLLDLKKILNSHIQTNK